MQPKQCRTRYLPERDHDGREAHRFEPSHIPADPQPIPMVSVRALPVRVVELLNEAACLIDRHSSRPSRVEDLRHAIVKAYRDAKSIKESEDRDEAARRKFVEARIR